MKTQSIFSQFSSVTLTTDVKHKIFNFSVNLKKCSKRICYMDVNGKKKFKTNPHYMPTQEMKLTRFEKDEFNGDCIRTDVYTHFGNVAGKDQVRSRAKLITEIANGAEIEYFLSGTQDGYTCDLVVTSTDQGQQIKGFVQAYDPESKTKRKQLKKLFVAFSELNRTETVKADDEIKTPYAYFYKGKKHDTVKNQVINYSKVIEDNTIQNVVSIGEKGVKHILSISTEDEKDLFRKELLKIDARKATAKEVQLYKELKIVKRDRDDLRKVNKKLETQHNTIETIQFLELQQQQQQLLDEIRY